MRTLLRPRYWLWMLLILVPLLATAQTRKFLPGDTFSVSCTQEPTLNVLRRIQSDGSADLPLVGKIDVAGLSPEEVSTTIATRLGFSASSVTVARVSTSIRGVSFSGAVKVSGEVPCPPGFRLSDLVRICGPSESADTEAIQIMSEKGVLFIGKLGSPEGDLELRNGDSVFFPIASSPAEVSVLGAVQQPGSVVYKAGLRLREAVSLVGGPTNHGDIRAVKLMRKGAVVATVDLTTSDDPELQRGDMVQVPLTSSQRFVTVTGFVKKPGLVEFRVGMTLADAVKEAGGTISNAATDRIEIRQILSPNQPRKWVDLVKDAKVKLNANDAIDVPKKVLAPKQPKPKKEDQGRRQVVPPLPL